MILSKEDNDIIINHLYKYNEGVGVVDKMAMDSYINKIEFTDNDIIFHGVRIVAVPIDDVEEYNIGKGIGEVGDKVTIELSVFDPVYREVFKAAIREIKINRINDKKRY